VNANKPAQPSSAQMKDLVPNIFTYPRNVPVNNTGGNTDQDIEVYMHYILCCFV